MTTGTGSTQPETLAKRVAELEKQLVDVNNEIKAYDLRKRVAAYDMRGHEGYDDEFFGLVNEQALQPARKFVVHLSAKVSKGNA